VVKLKKQTQSVRNELPDRFISVQSSAFSRLRQDEEREVEKTKPILGKGKSKKAKGKNESKYGVYPTGLFEKTKPICRRSN